MGPSHSNLDTFGPFYHVFQGFFVVQCPIITADAAANKPLVNIAASRWRHGCAARTQHRALSDQGHNIGVRQADNKGTRAFSRTFSATTRSLVESNNLFLVDM